MRAPAVFVCPTLPVKTPSIGAWALGVLWLPLVGCLSVDAIPTSDAPEDASVSAADSGEVANCADSAEDPLLGEWADESGAVCSFFENGRYTAECGVLRESWGFADTWSRMKDGRYFLSTSSLGSPADAFSVLAMFNEDCTEVILTIGGTQLPLGRR